MFVGREREKAALEKAHASGRFEFFVVYGRRRVGKTALLKEFLAGKNYIYYAAVEGSPADNLALFCSALRPDDEPGAVPFSTMRAALESVFRRAASERLVLVIDEYPYMARSDASLASTLQVLIDQHLDSSRLMLILCGSSVSFMEDEVLAYKAPLYGRKTGQIRLRPLDFFDAQKLLPHMSPADRALAYGVVGGTPHYLRQLAGSDTAADAIQNRLLDSAGMLFDEPRSLLMQELRHPDNYNALLRAIASGATRMKEAADQVHEPASTVTKYLRTLQEMELVLRETPYGEQNSRHSRYRIADNLFGFWFRFVFPNMSALTLGRSDAVFARIEPHLSDYMGRVFEDICRQYLWRTLGDDGSVPVNFQDLGRWWGTDPRTKSQVEIDIVGAEDETKALFAECKWSESPVDAGVLSELADKAEVLRYGQRHLALFAKRGFSENCRTFASEKGNVHLFTLDDMLSAVT